VETVKVLKDVLPTPTERESQGLDKTSGRLFAIFVTYLAYTVSPYRSKLSWYEVHPKSN
jgi:hypothetical protein